MLVVVAAGEVVSKMLVVVAAMEVVIGALSSACGVKSKRFGELGLAQDSAFRVAALTKVSRTSVGEAEGATPSSNAAAPATWGHAMEVPEMVLDAVSDHFQAEVMSLPGANISKQDP